MTTADVALPVNGDLVVDEPAAAVDGQLSPAARKRIRDAVPASTRRAYAGDWSRYTTWCTTTGRVALPTSSETLAEYATHLAAAARAPSTIKRALAAIATAHRAAGVPRPDPELARAVLRGYRRDRAAAGASVRKAAPVAVDQLRAMVAACDPGTVAGVRNRCLLVLGFALGARRSELAGLAIGDVAVVDDGLHVVIRTSKTDRGSRGRQVAVPYGSHPDTCPVRTTQAWLQLLADHNITTRPVLRGVDRHGRLAGTDRFAGRGRADGGMSGEAIALVVAKAAAAAGLDPAAAWTGHSLRRGFATEAYRAGADLLRIARHAGWREGSSTLLGCVDDVDRWQANPLVDVGL